MGRKMTKSATREAGIEGEKSENIIRVGSDRSGAETGTGNDREIRPRVASFVKSSVGIARMRYEKTFSRW